MTDNYREFPFEEVSRMDSDGNCCGDYANSPHELMKLGYAESQIWSVIDGDDDRPETTGSAISTVSSTAHQAILLHKRVWLHRHDRTSRW